MSTLKGLSGEVRRLVLDRDFRTGAQDTVDAGPYLVEEKDLGLGRRISLEPLRAVIEEAMRRPVPKKSDPWLAPRVHATLRLSRREAADKQIWSYLTVVEFPHYVRWRDADDPDSIVPLDRFLGEDSKNALARLWWAAELTRNRSDYSPTEKALSNSQFARSWQHLDALHHRPAALAVVDFLERFGDRGATDAQGQVMAKAFNLALRTLAVDSLSENPAPDTEAIREWCLAPIDETKMMDDLPVGPDEAPVPAEAVAAVREVLDRLAESIKLSEVKSPRRAARGELEEGAEANAANAVAGD